MDVTQIQQVVTIDDFVREHMRWLFTMLPIIWAAAAGAFVRLLLIRAEPFGCGHKTPWLVYYSLSPWRISRPTF